MKKIHLVALVIFGALATGCAKTPLATALPVGQAAAPAQMAQTAPRVTAPIMAAPAVSAPIVATFGSLEVVDLAESMLTAESASEKVAIAFAAEDETLRIRAITVNGIEADKKQRALLGVALLNAAKKIADEDLAAQIQAIAVAL